MTSKASLVLCFICLVAGTNALRGCWSYGHSRHVSYYRYEYCCQGYTQISGVCKPYCRGGCGNGTCEAPSVCNCGRISTGRNCETPICSHKSPCYPGICHHPNRCECAEGFGGDRCTTITELPKVMTANITLTFFDKYLESVIYNLNVVAEDEENAVEQQWTNIGKFNRMDMDMEALLETGDLPNKPSYVRSSAIGINSASITYTLTKADGSRNRTNRVPCPGSWPEADAVTCRRHVPQFDYRLDNGDMFTMRFEVSSGGSMTFTNNKGSRNFWGKTGFREIRLCIDFIAPGHCTEKYTCSSQEDTPLRISKDITTEPVQFYWSGWEDTLSGINSYVLEIFKLTGEGSILFERTPMEPDYKFNFTAADRSHTFTPSNPGMYSAILGAKDRANNTRYVREFFLFDDSSRITVEPSMPIRFTSASMESNYLWQTGNTAGKTTLSIDWTGHFVNRIHRDGGFLNSINPYPPQVDNKYLNTLKKAVDEALKNPSANRTSEGILNRNGIVRFEYAIDDFLIGTQPEPPSVGWENVSPLSENQTFAKTVSQGGCLLAWVRGYDILDNEAKSYTKVCFDSTPPTIRTSVSVESNLESDEFFRLSRVTMETLDLDSGISMIRWALRDNRTNALIPIEAERNKPIPGNKVNNTVKECEQSGDCYCIETGECFRISHEVDIDHCALYQSSFDPQGVHFILELTVYNQAMQNSSTEILIRDVQDLEGMDYCARMLQERLVHSGELTTGGITGIALCAVLLVAFAVFVLFLHKTGRLQKVKERSREGIRSIRSTIRRKDNFGGLAKYRTGGFDEDDIYMYGTQTYEEAPGWIVQPEDLTINRLLVVGKFARIFEGSLIRGAQDLVVAKVLKENFTENDAILMTAKINFFGTKVGRHSSVLEMIGAVMDDDKKGPVMILEYCGQGSIKDWLAEKKDHTDESTIDLMYRFVYAIVQGMEYLAGREITHMRLAARNILLTDRLEPKIAGFGPRHGDDEEEGERKERIPVKWIAPECISNSKAAGEKSDVWSCGVVMWEIFSCGQTPYPKVRSADLPRMLKRGERLGRPEICDDMHFTLMQNSWNIKPEKRPTFKEMREEIENVFSQSGDQYYYDDKLAH